MKRLFGILLVSLMGITAHGQATLTTSGTVTNGVFTLLLTNALTVSSIVFVNSDASYPATLNIYDNAYATNVYTNTGYTVVTSYLTNLTKTYTNAQSIITTNTQSNVLWSVASAYAGSSNISSAVKYTVTVPASTTVTAAGDWGFAKGVVIGGGDTTTNQTVTIYYRRFQ